MSADKLPDCWTRVKFGEVVQNVTERVMPSADDSRHYVGLEHMQSESLRLTGVGSEVDLVGEKLRMRSGDVLFARRNPHLRRVAVAPHDGPFSAHGMVLRTRDAQVLLQEFLPYFLQSEQFMTRANQVAVGSLSRTINWKDLMGEEFALPPIDEQLRAVEVLSLIDELGRRSETTLQAAEAAISSFVAQFDSTVETVKLSSVLSLLTKGTTPTSIGAGFSVAGVRFLKAENVIDGRIDYNVESFIDSNTDALLSRSRLQKGDVLLTIAGTIGRSTVVDDTDLPANCNQAVAILRPSAEVNPWFLSAWLGGVGARRQIEQRMVSNTISNLSLGVIGDLDFPVLTRDTQSAAVSGILGARSVARTARSHRDSITKMLGAVRSDLLSGGPANVQ